MATNELRLLSEAACSVERPLSAWDPQDLEASLAAIQLELRNRLDNNPKASAQWFIELSQLLLGTSFRLANLQRVEILIALAQWYADAGDRDFALRLLNRSLEIAESAGRSSSSRRALNVIGGVYRQQKEFTAAMIAYAKALDLADELGDRVGRCAVIANIGALRVAMGMVDDAIKLFKFVLEVAGKDHSFYILRLHAHHNLADSYLLIGDLDSAYEHFILASQIGHDPQSREDLTSQCMMEHTFTKILVKLGKLDEARERAARAMAFADKSGTAVAETQARMAAALCDAAMGKTDIALTRLSQVELELPTNDCAYRDLLEAELLCNQLAKRDREAQYYNKKYLSSISLYQRKSAIEQVARVKGMLKSVEFAETSVRHPINGTARFSDLFIEQMEALAELAELREGVAGEHAYRVGRLSALLALAVGYSETEAKVLEHAARLHDIGKLATPDVILIKRSKLTSSELEVMRRHPTEGCQMLTDLLLAIDTATLKHTPTVEHGLRVAAEIAQHHHEWWNGEGYPRQVSGNAIPEAARIVALADVFDELTHARPYKMQQTKQQSMREIEALSGKQFDPRLCREFLTLAESLGDIPARDEKELSHFAAANRVIRRIIPAPQ